MPTIPLSWRLQVGLHSQLTDDPDLISYFGGVPRLYDSPPPNVIFPFIALSGNRRKSIPGEKRLSKFDVHLDVFSRWAGRKEVHEISELVVSALEWKEIEIEGVAVRQLRHVLTDTIRQAESEIYRGMIRLQLLVKEPDTEESV